MQSYTVQFLVDAPPARVWRTLHPRVPDDAPSPRIIEYSGGRIEVLVEGDEAGQGLVRTCEFGVPKFLLSRGRARSWECVPEARLHEFARYRAVGKPLWSDAEGWHRLEEQPNGSTLLTFHETYHARNPVMRWLFEKRVHQFISRHNEATYEMVLAYAGRTTKLTT